MVEHMINILGDKLYKDEIGVDRLALPSPEELKGKILVKVGDKN